MTRKTVSVLAVCCLVLAVVIAGKTWTPPHKVETSRTWVGIVGQP